MSSNVLYHIPAGVPFLQTLATTLLAETGEDPLGLEAMTVLLPTRRAARALREAFLRAAGGRPLVLPRLAAVADIDEDELALTAHDTPVVTAALDLPPAISPLRRQLLLTRLVRARTDDPVPADQAVRLAGALAALLDQAQIEEVPLDRLPTLVTGDRFARHWQETVRFLDIVQRHWPAVLAEEGAMDPAARRNALIRAQAAAWAQTPPAGPVIVAGDPGTMPAVVDLMRTVRTLPGGRIVLAGLDPHLDAAAWAAVDDSHPQGDLKRLLSRLDVARETVRPWPGVDATPVPRRALVSRALWPAAVTETWHAGPPLDPAALTGLEAVTCPGTREEAEVIALALRETLETEGREAALVTLDRTLARRVAAALGRWGLGVDDSAGRPLALTPPGLLLRLTATLMTEALAPVPLLSVLKHPLLAGGMRPGDFRRRVRRLERRVLRGPRPPAGLAGLRTALRGAPEDLVQLGAWLEEVCTPLATLMAAETVALGPLLTAHITLVEALAANDTESGAARVWAGENGAAAATFLHDLLLAADALPPFAPREWPTLLEGLLQGQSVRPRFGGHPRLQVLGPQEARLLQPDLVVLGGLNEGTWPPDPGADPWMSRPMRTEVGLPLPERQIGQAAHDFSQLMAAPRVLMTRADRVEGTPAVPSRWWLRLEAVLRAGGLSLPRPRPWLAWADHLDQPDDHLEVSRRPPAPCPPVAARPRTLGVSDIETLRRDPYSLYAKRILKLRALEPLDSPPGPADYGTLVHQTLQRFTTVFPRELPPDADIRLRALFHEELAAHPHGHRPAVRAFWPPRFARAVAWLVAHERTWRHPRVPLLAEVKGAWTFAAPAGPFTLTARADRLESRAEGVAVIDYKTGTLPTNHEILSGYSPQLPLEGVMVAEGAFPDLGTATTVATLAWWRLGRQPEQKVVTAEGGGKSMPPMTELLAETRAGLLRLVAHFDDPNSVYPVCPDPAMAPRYSDYTHLSRRGLWDSGEGETP